MDSDTYAHTVGETVPQSVDSIFLFIVYISVFLLVVVTGLMIYFAIRYSRRRHPEPQAVKQRPWLEIVWTVIPTLLVLAMFFYGYQGFQLMRRVPEDAIKIKVTGRMWDWSFEYSNGKRSNKLYVPKGQNIKLEMKSLDVIHSFFIPAFRIKEDVVPGKESYLWFKPQTVGPADIFCAEYCGQRHAYMLSQVIVMESSQYDAWYQQHEEKQEARQDLMKRPAVQLMDKHGCLSCHSLDEPKGEQLPLSGLFGTQRVVIKDGQEIQLKIDEAYLRRALLEPGAEIVKNQINMMEPAEDLTEEELTVIIDFLKEYR